MENWRVLELQIVKFLGSSALHVDISLLLDDLSLASYYSFRKLCSFLCPVAVQRPGHFCLINVEIVVFVGPIRPWLDLLACVEVPDISYLDFIQRVPHYLIESNTWPTRAYNRQYTIPGHISLWNFCEIDSLIQLFILEVDLSGVERQGQFFF